MVLLCCCSLSLFVSKVRYTRHVDVRRYSMETKPEKFFFFHRGCEKPIFRTWAKSVFCTYLNNYFPWWKKLYSYLGHLDFLSRIPFQPSGKALALKSYPRKKKKASAVRNYYFQSVFDWTDCQTARSNNFVMREELLFFNQRPASKRTRGSRLLRRLWCNPQKKRLKTLIRSTIHTVEDE